MFLLKVIASTLSFFKIFEVLSGAVNSGVYHLHVMHFCKQVEPVFDMAEVAHRFSAWKIVVKSFCPVLDVLYCPFNNTFLKCGMNMMLQFQEQKGLRIPCASVS